MIENRQEGAGPIHFALGCSVQWVQAELRLNASGGPEAAALQSAAAASRLHRKHTDSMAELIEHVENLQRVMSKLEKDKQGMKAEINASVETTQKSKVRGIPAEPSQIISPEPPDRPEAQSRCCEGNRDRPITDPTRWGYNLGQHPTVPRLPHP